MSGKWSRSAELVNQRGLHARASAAFAREASKFNARVTVRYDGMTASAASIMDLLMLGARFGQTIEIDAEGPQAHEALGRRGREAEQRFEASG